MAGISFPARSWLGREPGESVLDMIMDGRPLPPGTPRDLVTLASGLARLAAPAAPGLLTGEAAALTAFRGVAARLPQVTADSRQVDPAPARLAGAGARRRRPRTAAGVRRRLAAAAAVAAVVLGGGVAAYAGVLPAALQDFAHRTIDAPAAGHGGNGQLPGDHPVPGQTGSTGRQTPAFPAGAGPVTATGPTPSGHRASGVPSAQPSSLPYQAKSVHPSPSPQPRPSVPPRPKWAN